MSKSRRYNLLCPIARALDRVGDRWALLILRDLHAGPARFKDLQTGLTGIATNLLTDRLQQLIGDGLIEKRDAPHGVALYALTPLGERTRSLLFELAMFGGQFEPEPVPRRPGNLRTIAVTSAPQSSGLSIRTWISRPRLLSMVSPMPWKLNRGTCGWFRGPWTNPMLS